jgi:hypothetical protein
VAVTQSELLPQYSKQMLKSKNGIESALFGLCTVSCNSKPYVRGVKGKRFEVFTSQPEAPIKQEMLKNHRSLVMIQKLQVEN